MPTAAKLVAAALFAMAAFLAAEAYQPLLDADAASPRISLAAAGIGLVCGWSVMGGLVGRGFVAAAGFGLRTMVTIIFFALLFSAIYDMVLLSMKLRYDGPMEAVVGIFELMVERVLLMRDANFIATSAIGGIVGGVAAEWAGRRWR